MPAPVLMKRGLLDKIEREIEKHSQDSPGLIQLKTNALEDKDISKALYQASQAGVKVDLLVRDSCRVRPGIPGLSENIRVRSIVGRFLEHARIYYFKDKRGAWEMQPDGSYRQLRPGPEEDGRGAQQVLADLAAQRWQDHVRNSARDLFFRRTAITSWSRE
ncbi:MAG: hypothetical protein ACREYF_10965 [Gammaproteobacteria bacterium]